MDPGELVGRGISFPPRVGSDGRLVWSEGESNIREAVRIILMTELGERIAAPEFGCGLGRYLFEPNSVSTRHSIALQIRQSLDRWEPRIAVEEVTVAPDPNSPESAVATVIYRLVATQSQERVSLNVTLAV